MIGQCVAQDGVTLGIFLLGLCEYVKKSPRARSERPAVI